MAAANEKAPTVSGETRGAVGALGRALDTRNVARETRSWGQNGGRR